MKLKKLLGLLLAFAMMIPTSIGVKAAEGDFKLTVLYTNDVHTYIDKDNSYATISQMKKDLVAAGENVLLVDAGDHIQGTAYGSMDDGKTIVDLMNAAGYDVATLGNHEFDYGMARALEVIGDANFPYVSCNFTEVDSGKTVCDPYKVFDFDGVKVAFVGVTTPETYTKSTPAYFMNAEQTKFIYDIAGGADGAALYNAVQNAINAAKAEADYVIAIGHCGDDPSSAPWRSEDVIANVTGLDAWIDGHSHSTVPMKSVNDKAGNSVLLTQTGSYFGAIGQMTITSEGIKTELVKSYEGEDESITAIQEAWIGSVEEKLGTQIGSSRIEFVINSPETSKRVIRQQETNLGDLNADAVYYLFNEVEGLNCDVAIMNGGGIRAGVAPGVWSYKTTKTVNTFGNVECLMEVKGQQIIDALEWGARSVGAGENGGFLQVAGITYDINTNVPDTVQKDENNIWTGGPTGEYRVNNVRVYDKAAKAYVALDPAKTYTLGGTNYTLRDLGDGFAMFDGAKLVKDYVAQDYLCFATYVQAFKDGVISTENSPLAKYEGYKLNYENWQGAGRITVNTPVVEATATLTGKVVDNGQVVSSMTIDFGKNVPTNIDKNTFTVNAQAETKEICAAGGTTSYGDYNINRTIVDVKVEGSKVTLKFAETDGATLAYLASARNFPANLTYTVRCNKEVEIDGNAYNVKVAVDTKVNDPETAKFESVIVEDGINYQLYVPENPTSLVVWFHGNGEGDYLASNNNVAQMLANRGTVAWATDEAQEIFNNAVVMAFQAPDTWYYAQKDGLLAKAHDEIMEVAKANGIDPEKIAVSGCSAGGYMTTRMIIAYPDLFAVAMINCPALDVADARGGETPTDEELAKIKDARTAIWLVQGEDDQTVKTAECSVRLFNILTEGQELVKTEVKGYEGIASDFVTCETKDGKYLLSIYSQDAENKLMFAEDYNCDGELELVTYSNHWSWIYTLRNNPENASGTHIWQWAASKLVKEEQPEQPTNPDTPVTPEKPGTTDKPSVGIYNNAAYVAIAAVALAGAAYVAFKKKED